MEHFEGDISERYSVDFEADDKYVAGFLRQIAELLENKCENVHVTELGIDFVGTSVCGYDDLYFPGVFGDPELKITFTVKDPERLMAVGGHIDILLIPKEVE